jgi:hypothetical protein
LPNGDDADIIGELEPMIREYIIRRVDELRRLMTDATIPGVTEVGTQRADPVDEPPLPPPLPPEPPEPVPPDPAAADAS